MPEVNIAEAATLLGTSTDTVRRRIKRGELNARRVEAGRLLVTVPDGCDAVPPASPSLSLLGNGLNELVHVQAELEKTQAVLEETRRHRDDLSLVVAQLNQHLEAAQVERAELRRLLAGAQNQLSTLLALPSSAGHLPTGAEQRPKASAQQVLSRRWWQFWRS